MNFEDVTETLEGRGWTASVPAGEEPTRENTLWSWNHDTEFVCRTHFTTEQAMSVQLWMSRDELRVSQAKLDGSSDALRSLRKGLMLGTILGASLAVIVYSLIGGAA